MNKRSCVLSGCDRQHYGKGYCRLHYRRLIAHGDPAWLPPAAGGLCKIDGCADGATAKDLCHKHYQRWRKNGDPLADRRPKRRSCVIDGCGEPAHGYGWCGFHYRRWLAYGDPLWQPPVRATICSVEGCGKPLGQGRTTFCHMHYSRRWRHGEAVPKCGSCGAQLPGDLFTMQFCDACRLDRRRRRSVDEFHRRRSQKAGERSERIDPVEIFERDRWRCGICRRKVNPKLVWPHPRSASLDHIVPLNRGGHHVRSNVQLAHLVCNTAKGDRGGGEQLLLIG